MRLSYWPVTMATILGLAAGVHAADLPLELSTEVLHADKALNEAQQKEVTNFVNGWTERLASTDDDQVLEARGRLLDALSKSGSNIFRLAYITQLINDMTKAIVPDQRAIVRLNAMILTDRVADQSAGSLIVRGMADPSPAVRYWAAKSLVDLLSDLHDTGKPGLLPDLQRQVLEASDKAMENHDEAPEAIEQFYIGINKLDVPQGADEIIKILNDRVATNGEVPGGPLVVDQKGMDLVFRWVIDHNKDLKQDTLRRLSLAAYRYMTLALVELNTGRVKFEHQNEYVEIVRICDAVMKFVAAQALTPVVKNAPDGEIKNKLFNKDWPGLLIRADEWNHVLKDKAGPFKFEDADLDVSVNS